MPIVNPIAPNSGNLDAVMNLPGGAGNRWEHKIHQEVKEIGWNSLADAATNNSLFVVDKNDRPRMVTKITELETQAELYHACAEGRLFIRPKNNERLVQFQIVIGEPEPGPDYSMQILKPEQERRIQEEREVSRLQVARTEPLNEVPLLPTQRPAWWKYLLFPFFMSELREYHAATKRNDTINEKLAGDFRTGFEGAKRVYYEEKNRANCEIINTVVNDRSIEQTIGTCRAYSQGARELDPDADLGENEDAMDGLYQIRAAHQRGMKEKYDLMQDIINGRDLAPTRAQLAERLGRVMVAEYLMYNVQSHILDCNRRGVEEVNPLYELVSNLGEAFDQMEENFALTSVVDQMTQMNPGDLLRLLSHPTEMAQRVNTMMTEKNNSWNMNGPQMENVLENQNPQVGFQMNGMG